MSLRTRRVKQSRWRAFSLDCRASLAMTGGLARDDGGRCGGTLQPSASCFGLPGRGVLGNASIHGRLGYAHKTMRRMVLSPEGGPMPVPSRRAQGPPRQVGYCRAADSRVE
ncbi:MAG: hypothetical protein LBT00_01615 [Spirochaetaceae bacterium]|nr:hypothetical protein [Spirochaetaceae bacterium]